MKGKYFLDTNILMYSFDHSAGSKRLKAQDLIGKALNSDQGIISYQVVQEFLNVAGRKFLFPSDKLHLYIDQVLEPLCEIYPNIELYRFALDLKDRFKYSFYDSLIIASALKADCKILYSEDLQNKQSMFSLEIINPF